MISVFGNKDDKDETHLYTIHCGGWNNWNLKKCTRRFTGTVWIFWAICCWRCTQSHCIERNDEAWPSSPVVTSQSAPPHLQPHRRHHQHRTSRSHRNVAAAMLEKWVGGGVVGLVVGLLFDPAPRSSPQNGFAYLVVYEDGQAEWHRCQPPRKAANTNNSTSNTCKVFDKNSCEGTLFSVLITLFGPCKYTHSRRRYRKFLQVGLSTFVYLTVLYGFLHIHKNNCSYCKSTYFGVLLYLANCVFSLIFVAANIRKWRRSYTA